MTTIRSVVKTGMFTEKQKCEEVRLAKGRCRKCNNEVKADAYDFDHKDGNPLNNSQENCQLVCTNCYGIKSAKESMQTNGLETPRWVQFVTEIIENNKNKRQKRLAQLKESGIPLVWEKKRK